MSACQALVTLSLLSETSIKTIAYIIRFARVPFHVHDMQLFVSYKNQRDYSHLMRGAIFNIVTHCLEFSLCMKALRQLLVGPGSRAL